MSEETTKPNNDTSSTTTSLTTTLTEAITLLSTTNPSRAKSILTTLQSQISQASIFSLQNESMDDISTSYLPLLAVEFHLGMAHLNLETTKSLNRKKNVVRAMELFHYYLHALETLGVLLEGENEEDKEILKDYHALLDISDEYLSNSNNNEETKKKRMATTTMKMMTGAQIRQTKIERYKRKKATQENIAKLQALKERRSRLNMGSQEDLDGYSDEESLERSLCWMVLKGFALDALEECYGSLKEMEMIDMSIEMERRREEMELHRGGGCGGGGGKGDRSAAALPPGMAPPPNSRSNKPMEVTRVTQDPKTGQLQFKKEQIRSGVFKPSWNQPTMTLAELGDIERARAIERSEKQNKAEAEAKLKPRRYDQLVKDGMEHNEELVDASAKLDREWDDWKDENPRGSGNKMGDRGDRNF